MSDVQGSNLCVTIIPPKVHDGMMRNDPAEDLKNTLHEASMRARDLVWRHEGGIRHTPSTF